MDSGLFPAVIVVVEKLTDAIDRKESRKETIKINTKILLMI